jgi:uncharacterized Zn finger protein
VECDHQILREGAELVVQCAECGRIHRVSRPPEPRILTIRAIVRAKAGEVTTLWTRGIDQVVVRASVHSGRTTIPLYQTAEGEDEFVVGEVYSFGGRRIRVSHIKLRDGPVIRKEGWKTVARRIKRIYGYLEGSPRRW